MTDRAAAGALPFLELVDHLRASGLPFPTQSVKLFADALAITGPSSLIDVRAAARATLCTSPEELALLDNAFKGAIDAGNQPRQAGKPVTTPALPKHDGDPDAPGDWTLEGTASLAEIRDKPIHLLTGDEGSTMLSLLTQIIQAPTTPRMLLSRLGRRHRADLHSIARNLVRFDGDLPSIPYKSRARHPVDLHIAVDVSGSMKAYAPTLVTFALFLQQRYSGRTTSFTLGTDCLPLAEVTGKDPTPGHLNNPPTANLPADRILTAANGGTNLGAALTNLAQQAVKSRTSKRQLLIFSDWWDAGDPSQLRRAMIRLRQLYATIVWANPHAAVPGYLPIQQGMATVMPHVDHLVSGHSAASLEEVLTLLARTASARSETAHTRTRKHAHHALR